LITLEILFDSGVIDAIDLAFARMVQRIDPDAHAVISITAALVSRAAAQGDVCLDLAWVCKHGIPHGSETVQLGHQWRPEQWRERLLDSSVIGLRDPKKIMILDGNRIYLQRYFKYEAAVARAILKRCDDHRGIDLPGDAPMRGDADQQRAAASALQRGFTIISGGPGTGKTFTIAAIIENLTARRFTTPDRILLSAPTGKAAARLQEAIQERNLPVEAKTVHRLLGAIANSARFRHDRDNPLAADLVIVDEASMIDLALMAKLLDAVPPEAHIVLVGDKDQLASVEAGAVLGDICGGHDQGSAADKGISDNIVVLKKNYRFGADSGIHQLGQAVTSGDADQALDLLKDPDNTDILLKPLPSAKDLELAVNRKVTANIAPLFSTSNAEQQLDQLMQFKMLAALRQGRFGVVGLNAMVEGELVRQGIVRPAHAQTGVWYPGKPVMVTRNDYHQNLFNGDIGIAVADGQDGISRLKMAFRSVRGRIQYLPPEQLPPFETVYAMTVHKSQGAEFDQVVLVLPDRDFPLLTRELIYTAITRARHSVEIWADETVLRQAIRRRIDRSSGLRDALWPKDD
jgi:exodeoxyribonuclease V alpha subunit